MQVNNYPYTTKQLTIGPWEQLTKCKTTMWWVRGHLWHFIAGTPLLIHGQIVDSPGLKFGPGDTCGPCASECFKRWQPQLDGQADHGSDS